MKRLRSVCLLVFSLLVATPLMGADASRGLVVRSPLYGQENSFESVSPLQVEPLYRQLGMAEEKTTQENGENVATKRTLLAIGDISYPVTSGDAFQLSYADGSGRVVVNLQVDGSRTLDIPSVGAIDCNGLTLPELKERVFSLISSMHAHANPQLTLLSTGSFTVTVVGEVSSKKELSCWGLSRLSSTVYAATPYASSRSVKVTSLDGTTKTYDLYAAQKRGDRSQDPLLSSGDVVTYLPSEKTVTINGMVRRPGTYQILEGETLSQLLSSYAGGVLPGGNIQQIRVQRYGEGNSWSVIQTDRLKGEDLSLEDLDAVMVDRIPQSVGSLTIQGAVKVDETVDPYATTALLGQSSGRIFYQLYPGETLGQMVRAISNRLMIVSDLEKAYLERNGERISLNLSEIVSGKESGDDVILQADDVLTIPFEQRFVTVSGAVARSGVYAYVPDKSADYYLALAGGATSDASKPLKVTVRTSSGEKLDRYGIIPAEATIDVKTNTFVKDLAPAVAVVGIVASVATIVYTIFETNHYIKTDF